MIGSLISMAGYYLVAFILAIWMVVKIARSSPLLALVVFLFTPASLYALVRYWGDRDSDIRVPFALMVLAFGMALFMANRTIDKAALEAAPYFTDDEIAMIRLEDPAMADAIEEARAKAFAENGEDYYAYEYDEEADGEYVEDDGSLALERDDEAALDPVERAAARARARSAEPVREVPAAEPAPVDPAEREAARLAELQIAAAALAYRFGSVPLSPAAAELPMPRGFRFAPRQTVLRVAKLRGVPVPDDLLGWVVHQKVDLTAADAWFVEVRFVPGGTEAGALELRHLLAAAGGDGALGEGAYAPAWSGGREIATWARQRAAGDSQIDLHAARPLREGLLLFAVRGREGGDEELGLRATRLMALRAVPTRTRATASL